MRLPAPIKGGSNISSASAVAPRGAWLSKKAAGSLWVGMKAGPLASASGMSCRNLADEGERPSTHLNLRKRTASTFKASVRACSLVGASGSSSPYMSSPAGVMVLFGVGSRPPQDGCQGWDAAMLEAS